MKLKYIAVSFCYVSFLWADSLPLPEPLNLQFVLSQAIDANHPELQLIDAQQAASDARLLAAESNYAVSADMELRARWIDPSKLALEQSRDDHRVQLIIQKKLYDFGQTRQKIDAEHSEKNALKIDRQAQIEKRKISIARKFFDVILSDLRFAWQDEAMATAYVNYDRLKDQHELGEISDVELFRSEANYQSVRLSRYSSEILQRQSRAVLAESLNRPDQLSSLLVRPAFKLKKNQLDEYEELKFKVLKNNPQIKLAQQQLIASAQRLQAARLAQRPSLNAEFDIAEYSRNTAGNNAWRAGLYLTVPLFENQKLKAEVAQKRADWLQKKAQLSALQLQVRQQLLSLLQNIQLLNINHQQFISELNARELRLDKSRALYEMEVATDLGNSMVNISEMQFKQAELEFSLLLAYMDLQWILGEKVNVE